MGVCGRGALLKLACVAQESLESACLILVLFARSKRSYYRDYPFNCFRRRYGCRASG